MSTALDHAINYSNFNETIVHHHSYYITLLLITCINDMYILILLHVGLKLATVSITFIIMTCRNNKLT